MRSLLTFACFLIPLFTYADPPARIKMLNGPAAPAGTVVREIWADRYNASGRLGWMQTLSYEITENNQTLIRTVVRDQLRYLRSGDPYSELTEQYSVETKEGNVVEVGYRTSLGKDQDLVIRGRPKGDKIVLEVLDHAGKKVVYKQEKSWDPQAKGLLFQDRLLEGKDLSPGKTYTVKGFMTVLNAVAPTTYTILGKKEVTYAGKKRELVYVEQTYPKELYLEKSWQYLDPATGETLLSTEDNNLFDLVTHERTTREKALAVFEGKVKDKESPVTIDKPIEVGILGLPRKLHIEIEMTEDDSPQDIFLNTVRQKFIKKNGKRAEYRLAAKELDGAVVAKAPVPGKEYLDSNFYIRSDDETVKKVTKEAIRDATEPRQQMERIARWVRKNVKGDYEVGFATADEVARTLEGDCTEMGVLAAAMGRAVGIPTRVCFGLVYDPDNPGFGGHLWTEAYVDGKWDTFDPTGVIPAMGAAYLRIDGYSMSEVLNPDELAGVRRGFNGRMKVYLLAK